jgi:DNA sulfur modification protein DndB
MMNEETVGVMLLPDTGNQIRHQVFLDINANASKPSKSIATLFDERDRLSDVTRNLLALPWVERYTNLERTTLPKSSGDLFTLNGLRDANRELLANVPESNWDRVAAGYWKAIAETIPQWRDILTAVEQEQPVDAPMLRQDYICFHSITLSGLGLMGQRVLDESGQLPDLSELAKVNWSRSNLDWEGIFLFEGKIIKNKQSATRFADYLQRS